MSAQEMKELAEASREHDWWMLLAVAVLGVLFLLIRTYVTEKAKNVATKEDVADITRRIEKVRTEYNSEIETLKGSYQIRVASLDRRLAVHQEAFSKWWKLMGSLHTPQVQEITKECRDWWVGNCVYLSAEARDAFIRAVDATVMHAIILRPVAPDMPRDIEKIQANWNIIQRAGDEIMRGAQLPSLPSEVKLSLPPSV